MVFVVRDATTGDVPEITALYNAGIESTTSAWTEIPYSTEERKRWLADQAAAGRPVLVAVDGAAVVGLATYGDFRDTARWPGYLPTVEHSIHVREDHWRRGVGSALMRELIDRARRNGKHVMVAGIDAANRRSIRFHQRLGFFEVARMPEVGEKFGRRLDLVLMQRTLDESRA